MIYSDNYDTLSYFLENNPEFTVKYIEKHLFEYPRFASIIIDSDEYSYYPEIIRLGKLYLQNFKPSKDVIEDVNSYIATASISIGTSKRSTSELDAILRNLLNSSDTTYNTQLTNKIFIERIGLPVGFNFNFDIKNNIDTIINLGLEFSNLYKMGKN